MTGREVSDPETADLMIIGGGVNGCGIARDAAGRGLSVVLAEQGDLGGATSSASTKLFHGGLRYLEHYEFRLVREALREREVLLRAMPHIAWPLRFVLPHHAGLRPAWLLRLGLFLYDHLGGRQILPGTATLDLQRDPAGAPLKASFAKGFEYSDVWVEDAKLVVLNARDAANRGATILPRTRVVSAERDGRRWRVTLEDAETGDTRAVHARGLVNAGGPWAGEILSQRLRRNAAGRVRLVRGSHVVVPRMAAHDKAYIFQNADGRVVFAIPYEQDFTLIGTTDAEHDGPPGEARCTAAEAAYLCAAASEYFTAPITPGDIVWQFAGVRPLYDDGAKSATAATRDYVLEVEGGERAQGEEGAPLLSIFGGKITTYRRLAEAALAQLAPWYPQMPRPWTATAPLPGGDFAHDGAEALAADLARRYPFLGEGDARRLVRSYGTMAGEVLGDARGWDDLGEAFGAGLTMREVRWLMATLWARTADDVLWRRSKLGLRLAPDQAARLDAAMAAERARPAAPAARAG